MISPVPPVDFATGGHPHVPVAHDVSERDRKVLHPKRLPYDERMQRDHNRANHSSADPASAAQYAARSTVPAGPPENARCLCRLRQRRARFLERATPSDRRQERNRRHDRRSRPVNPSLCKRTLVTQSFWAWRPSAKKHQLSGMNVPLYRIWFAASPTTMAPGRANIMRRFDNEPLSPDYCG